MHVQGGPDPPTLLCPAAFKTDEATNEAQPGFQNIVAIDNDKMEAEAEADSGVKRMNPRYRLSLSVYDGYLSIQIPQSSSQGDIYSNLVYHNTTSYNSYNGYNPYNDTASASHVSHIQDLGRIYDLASIYSFATGNSSNRKGAVDVLF